MIQKQGSWLPDINERVFPIVQPLIMKNTPSGLFVKKTHVIHFVGSAWCLELFAETNTEDLYE